MSDLQKKISDMARTLSATEERRIEGMLTLAIAGFLFKLTRQNNLHVSVSNAEIEEMLKYCVISNGVVDAEADRDVQLSVTLTPREGAPPLYGLSMSQPAYTLPQDIDTKLIAAAMIREVNEHGVSVVKLNPFDVSETSGGELRSFTVEDPHTMHLCFLPRQKDTNDAQG